MAFRNNTGECVSAVTGDGMLIIHSSPVTLSWIPSDVINDAYNFGGIVTVDTFDSIEAAKQAGKEGHLVRSKDGESAMTLTVRAISAALRFIRQRSTP